MNYIYIILAVVLFSGLRVDYKRDIGLHRKAKVIHAIILAVLMITFSGSTSYIRWFLSDIENGIETMTTNVGVINWFVFTIITILHVFLSFYTFIIAFRLMGRRVKQLEYLKITLPLLVITQTIMLYNSVIKLDTSEEIGFITVLVIGLILFGIPSLIILRIYNKPFMKDFFEVGDFIEKEK